MEGKKWYASKRFWSVACLVMSATITLLASPAFAILSADKAVALNTWLLAVGGGLGVAGLLSPQVPLK